MTRSGTRRRQGYGGQGPTKVTREDGSATYYEYDRIYQLTGETQVDDEGQVEYAFEYQYDKAHNRRVKVDNGTPTYYAYNEANELLTETTNGQTTYYQYDRCGNTVAKQEPSGTTYYCYDTENLMTRIDFADGGHNYFRYDADSKRVSKEDSEGFTEFIYQGPDMLKLLLERNEQGETLAHYTMGDGLEAMRRANGDGIASGTSSFYHYNHLGTTHELTDASQDISDTYRHDAWGVPLASGGSTPNPHTYVGRERYYRMPEAGLYHLGFRDYRPGAARFTSVDPAKENLNWFHYARNRPTKLRDPSGRQLFAGIWQWIRHLPAAVRTWFCVLVASIGLVAAAHAVMEWFAHQMEHAHERGRERFREECEPAWERARQKNVNDCVENCRKIFGADLRRAEICESGCYMVPPGMPTAPPGEFPPDYEGALPWQDAEDRLGAELHGPEPADASSWPTLRLLWAALRQYRR